MRYRIYSEAEMIDKSRELIHAFMNRRMTPFAGLLAEDFVWIGDYSSQYIQGKKAFLMTITEELNLPPLQLSREEYRVLTHERHTWVTYGRCMVTTDMGLEQPLASGIHFTFVWKQLKHDMYLMLASATHVQDEHQPDLSAAANVQSGTFIPQARVFYNVKLNEVFPKDTPKLRIRDLSGNLHFLFPDEIAYANSKGKDCTIHTVSGAELVSCMPLNKLEQPGFLRIHASYLVNRSFITSIRRHEVTLIDGSVLPVGKQRYNDVVKMLEKN